MITNRIKRGANASLPNGAAGEPLFTTDTYDLYIGKGDGTNQRYQKYMADAINGTGVANQLAYFSGANTIAGSTFLTLNLTADNGYLILTGGATYKNADIWLNRYSNAWENAIRFQTNGTTDWYVGSSATGSNSDFEIYNYGTSANGIKIAKATNNVTVGGTLTATVGALATAATNFVTSDSGTLKSRTASEVLSDIGAQATSEKGQNNGYASLDSGGKVPVAQLPNSIMEYKGNWNATTNTPTLADGTGNAGDVYLCNVAGTVNLGSGNITFAVGDWCVYNGTIWQKSINSNAVVSVNGQTGVVVITLDSISPMTTLGDIIYGGASGTATRLAGNTTTTRRFLRQTGTGTVSAAPAWDTVTKTDVGLSNVENTALSTWAGSTNITTLGTITAGTWNGTTIAIANGGTGATTKAAAFNALSPMTTLGDIIYGGASGAGTRLAGNTTTTRQFLRQTGTGSVSAAPAWDTLVAADLPLSLTTTNNAQLATYTSGVFNIPQNQYVLPNTANTVQWVNVGRFTAGQTGRHIKISIIGHTGYNALQSQSAEAYIIFKTADSGSVDPNGFAGDSYYYRTGLSTSFASSVKWVANAAGSAATYFDLYVNFGTYTFGSFYVVEKADNCTWSNTATTGHSDPGAGSSTVCVSTEQLYVISAINSVGTIKASIPAFGSAATKFLIDNAGSIESRTAAQTLSDIGGVGKSSPTANTITYWVDANTIGSLATSTYPSLTELSYVKGVTSAIQTQLNSKLSTSGGTITGSLSITPSGVSSLLNLIRPNNTVSSAIRFDTSTTGNWFLGTNALGTNLTNFYLYNYGTSSSAIDINYSDNNITFAGTIKASISALGSAASTFLVSDSGTIKSRTAAQVLSDIGAQASLSSPLAFGGAITATGYTGANYDNLTISSYYRVSGGSDTRTTLVMDAAGSVGPLQMEFNYNGAIRWRNKTDSTTWTSWRDVWTSSNDGTGSGLDADLLDGNHASYFEPAITAGTTAQYWRGDKTWQNFNTAARGAISLTTTNDSNAASYSSGVINVPQKVYTLPNTANTAQWVRVGRFTAGQSGYVCKIAIYGHESYNATITQNAEVEIFFKTSNGSSVDPDGFAGDSYYYEKGIASGFVQGVKWVSNANGVAASYFDLYVYFGQYSNGSFYTVNISDSTSWSNTGATGQTDPGAASASVLIPTQKYYIISDIESLGAIKASIAAFGSAASTFLISDSGTIKSRTAAQVLSDIGGVAKSSPTADTITYWVDANTIGSLVTSSYPSLTELSYVKGVTSAIQTQINGKLSLSGGTLTGALSGTSATFSSFITGSNFITDGSQFFGYTLKGRASDNYGAFGFYSNNGATRYGYIQSHSTNGGQLNITGDGGGQIILDNRGIVATGAATFSSSVTANQIIGSNDGNIAQVLLNTSTVTSPTSFIRFNKNASTKWDVGNNVGGLTADQFSFYSTSNVLVIQQNGNVGIGTTSPTSKLQINSTSAGAATVGLFLNNESNTSNTEIRLAFAANTNNDIASNRYSYISAINTSGVNGQALRFATNETGAAAVERMRITSGGNVYIGTTTGDGYKLQINGGSQAAATFGQTYSGVAAYSQWVNSSGAFVMGLDGAAGATERMRINSGGNVSIGSTNNTYKLDVTGTTFSTGLISRWYTPTGNFNYATAGSAGWVLIGTINLPQQGYDCTLTMQGGVGYNGALDQNGYAVLKMRTSNGTGYSAHYERYGRNGNFVSTIKIKSTGSDNYEIYAYTSVYVGLGYCNFVGSIGSTFTPSGTSTTDPGTGASITTVTGEVWIISSVYLANDLILPATGKLYLDGGSNTYITEASGDTIDVFTNGTRAIRVTSAQEVLINTTTDAGDYKLQVAGNIYGSASAVFGSGTGNTSVTVQSSVGTLNIKSAGDTATQAQLVFYTSATSNPYYIRETDTGDLSFIDNSTEKLKITSNGQISYNPLSPKITSATISGSVTQTPTLNTSDTYIYTGTASSAYTLTIANPTGTPTQGQKMLIRIKDNGTQVMTLAYGTQFRASTDLTLPTATTAGKTLYLGFIYNSTDTKWDLIARLNNF